MTRWTWLFCLPLLLTACDQPPTDVWQGYVEAEFTYVAPLNAGRIVTKERLQQAVASWDQAITPNAVEVHVSRVRAKLGDSVVLRAVRGLGYRLDEPR